MANPYTYNSGSTAGATSFNIGGVASIMTAGDVLVVNIWSAQAVARVTDTQSNSYVPSTLKGGSAQWVTTGKTKALGASDHITVTLASSGAGNAVAIGVPGAAYAGVGAQGAASGSGTSLSVASGSLVDGSGEMAIAMFASAGGAPTVGGSLTALGTSHGSSPEFVATGYQLLTAGATLTATATTGAWSALVTALSLTSFVGTAPVIPSQPAGKLATSSDMNLLAQAALWNRRPPMAIAQTAATGTGPSLTGGSDTAVTWASVQRDTDGFWNASNPTRLTVQTPGIYRVRYSIPFAVAGQNCQCKVKLTTGANNPAGSGVNSQWWYSFAGAANSNDGCVVGGGVMPLYMYAADYIEILAQVVTTSNMPITPQPGICSFRMVST